MNDVTTEVGDALVEDYYNNKKLKKFMSTQDTLTGTWIAGAGIVVSILAHFNIIVSQDSITAIIAGIITVYGIIHQLTISKISTGSLK